MMLSLIVSFIALIHSVLGDLNNFPGYNNSEIIDIPSNVLSQERNRIDWKLNVFGISINLMFERNNNLVNKNTRILLKFNRTDEKHVDQVENTCHYIHSNNDDGITATLSNCESGEITSLIFLHDLYFEIMPNISRDQKIAPKKSHIIKRVLYEEPHIRISKRSTDTTKRIPMTTILRKSPNINLTIEVAVFTDFAFHKRFLPITKGDNKKYSDLVYGYMNGVNAIFHHPTFGTKIDIAVVKIYKLVDEQSLAAPSPAHMQRTSVSYLKSFCDFQKEMNYDDDDNPNHWDLAVLLTGNDLYRINKTTEKRVDITGVSNYSSICTDGACVAVEFGAVRHNNKDHSNQGINSIYTMAHEIAHTFGLIHDDQYQMCPHRGFIMSKTSGYKVLWSECSARTAARKLLRAPCLADRSVPRNLLDNYPGRTLTAREQCQIYFANTEARPFLHPDINICRDLYCHIPSASIPARRIGVALDGTYCDTQKICYASVCTPESELPRSRIY